MWYNTYMLSLLNLFWYDGLFQPLVNALIWIYSNVTNQNLGWAVIWLTIFLRLLLLPFTIISERNSIKQAKIQAEAADKAKAFRHDPVLQQEEIRKIMKKNKISPWAKVFTLAIQLLVLILLYQVFLRGITGEKLAKVLYPWIDFPGRINTNFYGFEIGHTHDMVWSGLCALYMFIYIIFENRHEKKWQSSQVVFLFLFPAFTFLALWVLPMVKSLFILTSMVFSDIISIITHLLFSPKANKHGGHH